MSVLCLYSGCEEVLGRVEFALPSFRHKPQCQVSTAQLTWKCIHSYTLVYIGFPWSNSLYWTWALRWGGDGASLVLPKAFLLYDERDVALT